MKWYSKYLQVYEKPFAEAPQTVIEEVRRNLAGLQSNEPLVTVHSSATMRRNICLPAFGH